MGHILTNAGLERGGVKTFHFSKIAILEAHYFASGGRKEFCCVAPWRRGEANNWNSARAALYRASGRLRSRPLSKHLPALVRTNQPQLRPCRRKSISKVGSSSILLSRKVRLRLSFMHGAHLAATQPLDNAKVLMQHGPIGPNVSKCWGTFD